MSDGAIIAIVTAIVTGVVTVTTTVVGFLILWVKLKYGVEKGEELLTKAQTVEDKVDDNTKITKEGATAATENAKVAATAAASAKVSADDVSRKLNGGIDAAMLEAVRPIKESLEAHTIQDARDLKDVKERFDELTKYVHDRNHDILNALQTQSNKLEIVITKLDMTRTPPNIITKPEGT